MYMMIKANKLGCKFNVNKLVCGYTEFLDPNRHYIRLETSYSHCLSTKELDNPHFFLKQEIKVSENLKWMTTYHVYRN